MARRIQEFDWSNTPFGPIDEWPASLRAITAMMLESRFPMALWWGNELRQLYNDAYVPVLGGKHSGGLAQPAPEVWTEIWNILGPQAEQVLSGKGATWNEHLFLPMNRKGFLEETYFTFSYSPVRDDAGIIAGLLITCQETTTQIQSDRQLQMLRELGARAIDAQTAEGACRTAAAIFAKNTADVPFALLYLRNELGTRAHLVASAGFDGYEGPATPSTIDLQRGGVWPLAESLEGSDVYLVEDADVRFGSLPRGCWDEKPRQAVVVRLIAPAQSQPYGFLVAGISPLRPFDERYRGLFRLTADQIATAIGAARAFEEQRKRADALAEIDHAKTTFFSNVSHEFRTPLTLMPGPTEDLLSARFGRDLREQHAHVYALFMQLPVPVCVFRGEDLVFEMANDAMIVVLAHRDVVGARLLDVYPELKVQGFDQQLLEVLHTGKSFVGEEMPANLDRKGDGIIEETYWTLTYAPLRNPDGSCDRVMVASVEVTHQVIARRKVEDDRQDALVAQAQAEAAVRARDEFFTVASHELRTPLTTLGLQLDGLLRGLREHSTEFGGEKWVRKAERIREQTDRLEDLIERMMDTFSVGRPPVDLISEDVDLADVAREVIERFGPESKRARAAIDLSAQSVIGDWDRLRLDQVISQLVANALKFGAGKTVNVIIEGSDDKARITVIDRGIGIAPEHHERIFGRFERATSANHYGGFGLGLWIVRELVNVMGGSVSVKSEPDRGATFVVELPRRQ